MNGGVILLKKIMDVVIAVVAGITTYFIYIDMKSNITKQIIIVVLIGIILIAFLDLFIPKKKKAVKENLEEYDTYNISELILLDENNKPIKSWDLSGKISLLIGKEHDGEDVDVDLEECEYSALIDYEHAILNYCLDYWYIEDVYSKNGVRVQTINDGICYKVAKDRPCRLNAGDIIFIANTKLLIT